MALPALQESDDLHRRGRHLAGRSVRSLVGVPGSWDRTPFTTHGLAAAAPTGAKQIVSLHRKWHSQVEP